MTSCSNKRLASKYYVMPNSVITKVASPSIKVCYKFNFFKGYNFPLNTFNQQKY